MQERLQAAQLIEQDAPSQATHLKSGPFIARDTAIANFIPSNSTPGQRIMNRNSFVNAEYAVDTRSSNKALPLRDELISHPDIRHMGVVN